MICGVLFGYEMHTPRAHKIIERHMQGVATGRLRMPIARTFALSEAVAAHEYAETGHPFGRIVIKP